MKAAWYDSVGPAAQVLQLGELPTPEPGVGEVRVRLHASGVNPADVKLRAGLRQSMMYERVVPNSDGAGVVDAIGPGADPEWMGSRVWLYNGQRAGRAFGTAAEAIALDQRLLTKLPDAVDFTTGAMLGIPAMTAHRAVFFAGPVHGKNLLVTGGAGAVGNYAIQLAKWGGARVLTTVSGDAKADDAKAAGADVIINYRTETVAARVLEATDGAGVDHIVDVDFGANIATTTQVIKADGAIAVYASSAEEHPKIPVYELMRRNITLYFFILNSIPQTARQQAQREITAWLKASGGFHRLAGRFPLADIAAAHEAVEAGKAPGVVVVEPQS